MKVGDKIRSSTNKTWKGVILKKTIWGYRRGRWRGKMPMSLAHIW
jgi:hypothetical protein